MTDWEHLIDQFLKSKEGVTSPISPLKMILIKMSEMFKLADGWKVTRTQNKVSVSTYLKACEDNPDTRERALEMKKWIGEDSNLIKSDGNKDKSGTVIPL